MYTQIARVSNKLWFSKPNTIAGEHGFNQDLPLQFMDGLLTKLASASHMLNILMMEFSKSLHKNLIN